MLLSPPRPHVLAVSSSSLWVEVQSRAVCVVCLLVCLRALEKKRKLQVWGQNLGHTSVCRSMISWPTRGMVALVFSHSTVCSSRGEAATVSRSFLTQDGGEWVFLMPSHALLLGVCCLSLWEEDRRKKFVSWDRDQICDVFQRLYSYIVLPVNLHYLTLPFISLP